MSVDFELRALFRERLSESGKSVDWLACMTRIKRVQVVHLLVGEEDLHCDTAQRLADALDLDLRLELPGRGADHGVWKGGRS